MCAWRVDQMVIKILISLTLFFQLSNISFACSFNCGSVSSDKYSIIIKPPAHTGFKKHSFPNGPVKKHSFSYIREKAFIQLIPSSDIDRFIIERIDENILFTDYINKPLSNK